MTGAAIAQLIIALGPTAFSLAKELANVWTKELTIEEVNAICDRSSKTYDEYIAEARAKFGSIVSDGPA